MGKFLKPFMIEKQRLLSKRDNMRNILAILFVLLTMGFVNADDRVVDHVVVVLDDSGSMSAYMQTAQKSRMETAKSALKEVLSQISDDSELGIILLNRKWVVPLGKIDRKKLDSTIDTFGPTGGTPLGAAMKEGCDVLLAKRAKDFYGTYRLLIVTDGEANDQGLVEQYLPDIMARGVTVDVIGLDMGQQHSLATKVKNYRRGDDPDSLKKALAASFAETSLSDEHSLEDYQLTSALPEEVAVKVIKSLKETGNHPIGETPVIKIEADGSIPLDASGSPITVSASGGLGWGLICVIVFVIGIVAIITLIVISNS